MDNIQQTYYGYVSRFDQGKNFGIISTEEESYFFIRNREEERRVAKSTGIKNSHKLCVGDEVEFQLRVSQKDNKRLEAFNLKFIRNVRRQELVDDAKVNGVLHGYLKQIGEVFFVKHVSTYVFLPVKISEWEIDCEQVYSCRLNELVPFTLTQTEKLDKLEAVLTDRKISTEYQMVSEYMQTARTTEAKITGKNIHGFFATVFNGTLNGFIRISIERGGHEQNRFMSLKKGDTVLVTLKVNPNIRQLILSFVDY